MKRKILFICLGILIVFLLGVSIFYIKYIDGSLFEKEQDSNVDYSKLEQKVDILGDWFSFEYDFYDDGNNVNTYQMNSLKLSFWEDTVNVCDLALDDCEDVKYTINEDKLNISNGEKEIFFGEYIISYKENMLLLELKYDEITEIIYRFKRNEEIGKEEE